MYRYSTNMESLSALSKIWHKVAQLGTIWHDLTQLQERVRALGV